MYHMICRGSIEYCRRSSPFVQRKNMAEVKPNPLTTRDFSRVILTLENVLIPDDKLSPTPSMQDGLDLDTETDLRILGCELIQSAGILLKLPQVGSVLF